MEERVVMSTHHLFLLRIALGRDPNSGEIMPADCVLRDRELVDSAIKVLSKSGIAANHNATNSSSGSAPNRRCVETVLKELTDEQRRLWDLIECSGDAGIDFQRLCEKSGFCVAKVQGDLASITTKSHRVLGRNYSILNKKNSIYYPYGLQLSGQGNELETTLYQRRIMKIRSKHPNAYKSWDEEQDSEIERMFKQGVAIRDIAKSMGRQPGSIRSRLKKISNID